MPSCFPVAHSLLSAEALALEVAAAYALPEPVTCQLISQGVNDTYQVTAGDEPYILRVYRHGWRTADEVEYELALLRHLQTCGVPVSVPVGPRLALAAPEGPRSAVLFTHAPGKVLQYDAADALTYGRLAAEMHLALDGFAPPLPRLQIDLDLLLERPLRAIRPFAERQGNWELFAAAADRLRSRFAELERRLTWGVCHGDLHGHNVHKADDGRLTLFDFDCGGPGWRAYDLAVYRWAVSLHARSTEPWEAFVRGYQEVRPIAEADLAAVPLFVGLRTFWILGLPAQALSLRGTATVESWLPGGAKALQKWLDEEL